MRCTTHAHVWVRPKAIRQGWLDSIYCQALACNGPQHHQRRLSGRGKAHMQDLVAKRWQLQAATKEDFGELAAGPPLQQSCPRNVYASRFKYSFQNCATFSTFFHAFDWNTASS